jgi:hypothetical protein
MMTDLINKPHNRAALQAGISNAQMDVAMVANSDPPRSGLSAHLKMERGDCHDHKRCNRRGGDRTSHND